jgi:ribonuclease MRP protein subunit RMP1
MPCTEYSVHRSFTKSIRKIDLISMSGYLNDASGLEAVSGVMQLVYYRNKNQHRLAKWWKWLSMLRRCVQKLLAALQAHDRDRAVCRVDYIQQILLPRCYT